MHNMVRNGSKPSSEYTGKFRDKQNGRVPGTKRTHKDIDTQRITLRCIREYRELEAQCH